MHTRIHRSMSVLLAVVFLLSACLPFGGANDSTASVPTLPFTLATLTPAVTPTALPKRVLSVCIGEQPNSLYPLGALNGAARSVLAAIYDAPFDTAGYDYKPGILEKMPSLNDRDAQVNAVAVRAGDRVVDAAGEVIILQAGSRVRPSGCRNDACAVTYDGNSPLSMDQMFVDFKFVPDLKWSDGTPVTADDSVYAFGLAKDDSTPGSKYVFDRTVSYEAADESTVQWFGMPGFVDPTYFTNVWMPLPQKLWGQFNAKDLLTIDISSRVPMGYGAYVIKSWEDDTIRLEKNPYYYRSAEGLPKFDELIFRVTPDPDVAVSDLLEGRCDLIDSSVHLDAQVSLLQELNRSGQVASYFGETPTMEWLTFGINPASYDDAYSPTVQRDRPDFFGDPRLRQAVAYCVDRQKVVDNVLFGLVPVPNTYISSVNPIYASGLPVYEYNPIKGQQILDSLGWLDYDRDPNTPREAIGVDRVPPRTKLVITYTTTSATQRRQVSEILAEGLRGCQIGVDVVNLPQADFYAEGPLGIFFGRQFDLAETAMAVTTILPPCAFFTSNAIPNAANNWIGTNVGGYKSDAFDAACKAATQALPDEATYLESYRKTQLIFATDLPAIPLYNRVEIAAARFDFCNFALDPTTATDLYAIETFDYGESCLAP